MTVTDEPRSIAREGLQRTKPFTLDRAADDPGHSDGLTLTGHAAVFNDRTLIDSWEGRFWEEVARGAFKKTFAERTPVLQFDHGHHPLIGSIPIGRLTTAKEDTAGAFVQGRLHDNWLIQPVRDAIRDESISGMSFRFTVVQEEWRDAKGAKLTDPRAIMEAIYGSDSADEADLLVRTLRELKVPELGPVVFPAYDATDVGVRSGRAVIDLGRLREDPHARRQLARALWVAERGDDTAEEGTVGEESRPDVPDTAAATLLRSITEQLTALTELLTPQTPGPDPDPDREATTAPTDSHAAPEPDEHRHSGDQDEPPEGHSSPPKIPPSVNTREKRKHTLAYIEDLYRGAQEKQSIYGRCVEAFEQQAQESGSPS